ncbi:twin-arginine translocase subunit TatC [Arthrobacter sp. H14]|uniref:twin-arginine translocase subunit TatC n=1 Tax=Arthrobacter sp. H14 TaxID=1312959 RepID=UPI0004795CD1|nr:twin-arginine translocase subunit TatC [Arthrobacter sp. H14]
MVEVAGLIKSAIGIFLGGVAGFLLYNPLFSQLIAPIMNVADNEDRFASINFDGVASSFDLMVQTSVFLGLLLSSPVWLYQMWAFITPGLKDKERRVALSFMAVSVPLFVGGVFLAWLVLPNAVRALLRFTPEGGSNVITAQLYLTFVMRLLLAFGIAFLLPVVLFGLNLLGVLSGRQILKSWRITVLFVCVLGAMAAPGPDIMSMFYLVIPLLFFFFLATGLCLLNDKRRRRRTVKREDETEAAADTATSADNLSNL